jgi:response regulator RpfG family c-di-GMP phosphodiesterase
MCCRAPLAMKTMISFIPEATRPDCVLFVGLSPQNCDALTRVLNPQGVRVLSARSRRDALSLVAEYSISLVICEQRWANGGWRDLLSDLAEMTKAPALVILADEIDSGGWAEAINLGAHDVLLTPIVERELKHVVSVALNTVGISAGT